MLFSFSLIFIIGFMMSGIFKRLKIPGILGMLATGIFLGPFSLDLISKDVLNISSDLRQIALVVILARAGLSLKISDLKRVGRPAILMCFIPATLELIAVLIFAPIFFGISYIEALIMGTVLAAVSPAVIVPRMLKIMDSGYGKDKSIPQLILAGASVDDIYVIVLFTSFLGIYEGNGFNIWSIASVPISIIIGLLIGIVIGVFLDWVFRDFHMRDTIKVIAIISVSFILVTIESVIKPYVPMSGLLAIMAVGGTILKKNEILARRLSTKLSKVWVGAEVLLFVLVGASVDITYIGDAGILAVILILIALMFRVLGVYLSLMNTELNMGEKLFCAISYLPKATVQAAIGAIPLSRGVGAGNMILTIAVLAIVVTAPIGAIGVDFSYKKLLSNKK